MFYSLMIIVLKFCFSVSSHISKVVADLFFSILLQVLFLVQVTQVCPMCCMTVFDFCYQEAFAVKGCITHFAGKIDNFFIRCDSSNYRIRPYMYHILLKCDTRGKIENE